MRKRLLSALLALCMVLALLPGTAWATEYHTYDCLTYHIQDGEIEISDCDKSIVNVDIPEQIDGLPVTSIGSSAFAICKNLKSVSIPKGIKSIGWRAFSSCEQLTSIIIPEGVASIGAEAFSLCANLTKIVIPSSVVQMGYSMGQGVFPYCDKLTSAGPIGGGYNCEFGWTDSIPDYAFVNCTSLTNVDIPDGITSIGESAFRSTKLTDVNIPDSVTSIGENAFFVCTELAHVSIPDSVVSMGDGVFSRCDKLTSAGPIGGNYDYEFGWTDSIPDYAFSGCRELTSVILPNSITSIGQRAFNYCIKLPDITIPKNVNFIGAGAFEGCHMISSFTIPNGVTSLEGSVLRGCKLTSIIVPNGVTSIGTYAFEGCTDLEYIVIPSSVTSIGYRVFARLYAQADYSLADVYYSGSESDWEKIDIDITNELLFDATIHYNSTGPDSPGKPDEDLETKNISGVLRSGDGCRVLWQCTYQVGTNTPPQDGKLTIFISSTDAVAEELFLYNENTETGLPFPWELEPYNLPKSAITSLTIRGESNKLLRVPVNAFQGYDQLEQVSFDCVSAVDDSAFAGCTALRSAAFSETIKHIGASAFQNTDLQTILLGRNVETIGNDAFAGCSSLKIRCYKDSPVHKYALENSIPVELIDETLDCTNIYCGNGAVESFEHDLDYYISQTTSTTYSPTIAHMLMALSYAAYNQDNISKSFASLGFLPSDTYYDYSSNEALDLISYAFAKKTLPNGKRLVLVAIKGSSDFSLSHLDWLSNAEIGPYSSIGFAWHAGFEEAVNEVFGKLRNFISNDFSNTVFVATGHSRGAAVANLLEMRLFENKVSQQNVYGYNFACPDVATGLPTVWSWLGEHDNMFNIAAAGDPVSVLPGMLITLVPGTSWGKFGQSRWFASNWNNLMETTLNISNHDPANYLAYMRKEASFDMLKTWADRVGTFAGNELETIGKLFRVNCPVDVEVLTSDGTVIASVTNGIIDYHNSATGKVIIFTDGDRKSIYVQGNNPLTIQLTAIGTGTMDYIVQTVNLDTSEVLSEKSFANVELITGKQMRSLADVEEVTGVGVDVSKVPLYVLDDSGEPAKEVLPDGNGTEVPITTPDEPDKPDDPRSIYTITFDPNGGTISTTSAITETNGKLTTLPTPTRTGYTFIGWFAAISGGTQITTDTVFDGNTTVYAHWSYNGGSSTDGDNWKPSGNPSYSSGGSSTSPSYSITAPSVEGGTISISPKSASKGSTVTVTTNPDAGYILTSLTAKDKAGNLIDLTDKGDGKHTFIMPSSKVTIDAVFQLEQSTTPSSVPTAWSSPFTDVLPGAWYYDAVQFVSENGLMNGTSNTTFAPDANLSRAMLAQILYNKESRPSTASDNMFTDVANDAWYTDAVTWAVASGIVGGYGNGLFGPDDPITREQLAVMLWRYAGEPTAINSELHFNDAEQISGYAQNAMYWAVENGIINGKGNDILDPKGCATRAQVAQMLENYLEK